MSPDAAGELYDQIRVAGRLPLARARFYAAEVVLMLEYLQARLKPTLSSRTTSTLPSSPLAGAGGC